MLFTRVLVLITVLFVPLSVGCGGSNDELTPGANQSEIDQMLAQNPELNEEPPEGDEEDADDE